MKLLFVSQSARIIYDTEGNAYINAYMNCNTIQRYATHCDELTLFFRDSGIRLSPEEAKKQYNPFPWDLAKLIVGYNPFFPMTNWLKIGKRRQLHHMLEDAVCDADRIIITSADTMYAGIALKFCRKYNKQYMLIVGGFALEGTWRNKNHFGKLVAPIAEYREKKNLLHAPYALYVTEYTLQKRYPCRSKSVGCSDVEVPALEPEVLEQRLRRITALKKSQCPDAKLVLGTAAVLADARKGHKYVIRALAKLKEQGITRVEYQLLGAGSPDKLLAEAERYGVTDQIKVLGSKPHEEVYAWLDQIDIYIQPSFSEGLCRAIVEAMSRGCPVLSSDAGGNVELCDEEFLFKAGRVDQIARQIRKMLDPSLMERAARENFARAKRYEETRLDEIRDGFLNSFMKEKNSALEEMK